MVPTLFVVGVCPLDNMESWNKSGFPKTHPNPKFPLYAFCGNVAASKKKTNFTISILFHHCDPYNTRVANPQEPYRCRGILGGLYCISGKP